MLNKQYYVEKAKVEKLIASEDKPEFPGTPWNQRSNELRCH